MTPWTSQQFITRPHRDKQPFALTFPLYSKRMRQTEDVSHFLETALPPPSMNCIEGGGNPHAALRRNTLPFHADRLNHNRRFLTCSHSLPPIRWPFLTFIPKNGGGVAASDLPAFFLFFPTKLSRNPSPFLPTLPRLPPAAQRRACSTPYPPKNESRDKARTGAGEGGKMREQKWYKYIFFSFFRDHEPAGLLHALARKAT